MPPSIRFEDGVETADADFVIGSLSQLPATILTRL